MRVPKTTLESRGFVPRDGSGRELVKLLVVWPSGSGKRLEEVFANYYPGDRRAEVYLGRLSHDGNGFSIAEATRYGYDDFVAISTTRSP